jgi:hypothetical protein
MPGGGHVASTPEKRSRYRGEEDVEALSRSEFVYDDALFV